MLNTNRKILALGVIGAALASATSSMLGRNQIAASKTSCVKGSAHATKRGPGRYHLDGEGRKMNKLGRHLLKARHVLADFMRGKSPVGSKKKGGK